MTNALLATLVAATTFFGLGSNANAQEGRIRQATQNHTIEGRFYQELNFTVSISSLSDILEVRTGNGALFARMTAAQFITSGFVTAVISNSGGNVSLRCRFQSAQPAFNGGNVALFAAGTGQLLDRDRIRLR